MNTSDLMPTSELIVWSAMLGGLFTIAILSVAEWFVDRWQGAMRNVIFVVTAGSGAVLMTGLPQFIWPDLRQSLMVQALQSGLSPLAGAAALYYLGQWLGGHREDPVIHRVTGVGATLMAVSGVTLALVTLATDNRITGVHYLTALVNVAGSIVGILSSLRASRRGDPLARWMALNCVVLLGMVSGLALKLLQVQGFGLMTWVLCALLTQVFFLATMLLFMMRHREQRRLARHAQSVTQQDPTTGLATGPSLLDDVGHAFWRAARAGRACTVVMIDVRNLYALSASQGHGSAQLIQAALAARLRRAAGLRSVIGLYQPRCFALVFSSSTRAGEASALMHRLRKAVESPVEITGHDHRTVVFRPQLAWGSLTLDNPGLAQAVDVLRETERRTVTAESSPRSPHVESQDNITTQPASFL